jgi:hypothetical protein
MKKILNKIWKFLEDIGEHRAKNHQHHGWW